MLTSTVALGLLGLAAASPLRSRQASPSYPPTSISKGFNLIVNVTDPDLDFSPSIQNTFVTSIHTGAASALLGVNTAAGRIFYQNGTAEEQAQGAATTISDSGTPSTPAGLSLTKDQGTGIISTANLNFGYGTPGVQLSSPTDGYSYLLPETFMACNQSLPYYQGKYFVIIKQVDTIFHELTGEVLPNIPANCVPISLVPQCTQLPDLAAGSFASHDFALDSACYDNVSELNWSEYGS